MIIFAICCDNTRISDYFGLSKGQKRKPSNLDLLWHVIADPLSTLTETKLFVFVIIPHGSESCRLTAVSSHH